MLLNGNKYSLARNLNLAHPNLQPILFSVTLGVMPEDWSDLTTELGVVLKCSFSETSSHVIIPQKEKYTQHWWDELISSHTNSTKLYGKLGFTLTWYAQPFNKWIQTYGEV